MVAKEAATESEKLPVGLLIAAWLVPGGGQFLQRRWGRGALLLGSIGLMFALGLAFGGRFFTPAQGNFVETLGYLGDLCSGLLYLVAKLSGYDMPSAASPVA